MAVISLNTSPALTQVTAGGVSLAPNIEPLEPSIWPLAPGYWVIIVLLLGLVAGGLYWYRRGHFQRKITNELSRIASLHDEYQQLLQLHQLLRWLAIHHLGQSNDLSPEGFEQWIRQYNEGRVPSWLNSHYQKTSDATIDWTEVAQIVKAVTQAEAAS